MRHGHGASEEADIVLTALIPAPDAMCLQRTKSTAADVSKKNSEYNASLTERGKLMDEREKEVIQKEQACADKEAALAAETTRLATVAQNLKDHEASLDEKRKSWIEEFEKGKADAIAALKGK